MSHTVSFTEEELKALVLGLTLGNWMANASGQEELALPALEKLLKKVGSEFGSDDVSIDEECMKITEAYDENALFEGLAHRLAERDVHEKLDHDPDVSEEDYDNRLGLESAAAKAYHEEFETHGLKRVVVNRRRYVPCDDPTND